ncbi:peptidoglycan/LPS O-acetylase OafA/YrhL [Alicyclobacillus sacchari]|uniref:Peptidoglycan/LPS O-acetylase OafA/YrhL n=1 Tax=Alicyclobacillus sacchari TaxID=392010 RepID=A0A4R8LJZ2_9BACL|nr:peptidoglycan/LPS O-acetylase OafA/YrhL [Alicyclobacillus sacchari]
MSIPYTRFVTRVGRRKEGVYLKKPHLYEIDLMRACIILGVICVHILSGFNVTTSANSGLNIASGILIMTFHFTREAFMFITGLVLFYTYYDRSFSVLSFWRKRLLLIAIPYVAWTTIYILFEGTYLTKFQWTRSYLTHEFVGGLLTANQFFMYFLLVSMQLYVLFPLMVRFMRRYERFHLWIFAFSFAIEVGIMVWNQASLQFINIYQLPTWLGDLVRYRDRIIFTYEFWFVAGALMAIHYTKIKVWALGHTRMVVSVLCGFWLALFGFYFLNRFVFDLVGQRVLDTLQPIMVPYSFVVALVLWLIGLKWHSVSKEPNMRALSKVIRFFGGVSFGIFLIHPIALHFVDKLSQLVHGPLGVHFALLPLWIAMTYVLSGLAAYCIGKIPYIGYIVGEKANWPRVQKSRTVSNAV